MTRATWSPEDRAWLDSHPGEGIGLKPDPYHYDGACMESRKDTRKAEALHPTEEASLVAEGRTLARRNGMKRATLAALANITRIGQGRG